MAGPFPWRGQTPTTWAGTARGQRPALLKIDLSKRRPHRAPRQRCCFTPAPKGLLAASRAGVVFRDLAIAVAIAVECARAGTAHRSPG